MSVGGERRKVKDKKRGRGTDKDKQKEGGRWGGREEGKRGFLC